MSNSETSPPSLLSPLTRPTSPSHSSLPLDLSKIHPLAHQGSVDYLTIEEDARSLLKGGQTVLPGRGWSDELCYGAGTGYLGGLVVGGVWGFREGLRKPIVNSSAKLRLNAVLNSLGRRGSFLGNSAGVLAIMYNIINSSLDAYRGEHDIFNSLSAATITGFVFKATNGFKPALVSAGIMSTVAAGWTYGKRYLI